MTAHQGARSARVVTITVSDTRTAADDRSGDALRERLGAHGHAVVRHAIVRDDIDEIRRAVLAVAESDEADAVVLTGGTGIAPRDVTWEAVAGILDKTLDGFGEAFRRVSWDEIGPRAVLSRAIAGVRGNLVVAALPGSTGAVRTGVDAVLGPTLGHMVALRRG